MIERYNATPQAILGDSSPHELVYGPREGSSSVLFEELPDSSPEQQDSSPERDTSSGCASDGPPSKRLRSDERLGSESSDDGPDPLENPAVSRQERTALIKLFKKEQRLSRKRYRTSVRGMWEADIADDKENRPSQEEEKGGEPLVT